MSGRECGTRAKYVVEKCRCDDCRKANRDYHHSSKRNLAPAYVNAARTRQHIRELRDQGVGKRAIAKAAGVSLSSVMKIASGEVRRIRPDTESAICGVTSQAKADSAYVDAAPTHAVIEQLVARGWTRRGIARAIGNGNEYALQIPSDQIKVRRAKAIAALLDEPAPARYDRWGNLVDAGPAISEVTPAPEVPVDVDLPRLDDEGDTSWMRSGACRINRAPTWVFFPGRGDVATVDAAKKVCATCRVAGDCRDYALRTNQTSGVWGGLTQIELRQIRSTMPRLCRVCGCDIGGNPNRKYCEPCAKRRHAEQQRASRGRVAS